MQEIGDCLLSPCEEMFAQIFKALKMTEDSGCASRKVQIRSRQKPDATLKAGIKELPSFEAIRERFAFDYALD